VAGGDDTPPPDAVITGQVQLPAT